MGEQVFHFYVLNNKAKPLSPTELRRTISTSLSNAEIEDLWKRFEDPGVNPEATRWTHKISSDPDSPFKDLVDFGLGGSGFIKENVAYQLVSKFVNMPRKYRILYEDVPTWQQGGDERLTYFYEFWSAIRERYSTAWADGVAAHGSQFFYKAAMLVLQEFILDLLVQIMNVQRVMGKPSPFADFEELKQFVWHHLPICPQRSSPWNGRRSNSIRLNVGRFSVAKWRLPFATRANSWETSNFSRNHDHTGHLGVSRCPA
jgi:hypothetical protein